MRGRTLGLLGLALVAAGLALALYLWQVHPPGSRAANALRETNDLRIPVDDPALIAAGAPLYREACASCHGADLQGEANWKTPKPDGTLPAPPHDASGHTWHHPDGFLFAYTKLGGQPFMPEGRTSAMPAFGDQLSDREIIAILAYIKSAWPEEVLARQQRITDQSGAGD
ncbi:MAG: cytochrome c [Marivibrio sp.]|uniref:c-type cytochrome n=1 Tax=Marivibrio sp. TaxID=2039719 RepID=UPI0032EAB913